jgi:hypothetical protein
LSLSFVVFLLLQSSIRSLFVVSCSGVARTPTVIDLPLPVPVTGTPALLVSSSGIHRFVSYRWLRKHCRLLLLFSGCRMATMALSACCSLLLALVDQYPDLFRFIWFLLSMVTLTLSTLVVPIVACCSHGWPQWHCPFPVCCWCTDGHIDTVGCFLIPWTSNPISCLVVLVDGHNGNVHSCVRFLFRWWLP